MTKTVSSLPLGLDRGVFRLCKKFSLSYPSYLCGRTTTVQECVISFDLRDLCLNVFLALHVGGFREWFPKKVPKTVGDLLGLLKCARRFTVLGEIPLKTKFILIGKHTFILGCDGLSCDFKGEGTEILKKCKSIRKGMTDFSGILVWSVAEKEKALVNAKRLDNFISSF